MAMQKNKSALIWLLTDTAVAMVVSSIYNEHNYFTLKIYFIFTGTENESGSAKKEKDKKNRKKDKENGSTSGDTDQHNGIDAPDAVVSNVNWTVLHNF